MANQARLRVVVVHNRDFDASAHSDSDPAFASRADVENAARDVATALTARGFEVEVLPIAGADGPLAVTALQRAVEELRRRAPHLVFNLCESLAGDARHERALPALLELAGLPYTGSGPLGLGLALRKDMCKRMLAASGVATPEAVVVDKDDRRAIELPFPLIVKPTREDASVGITLDSVVHNRRQLAARLKEVHTHFAQPALVERFIAGRELYVSLLGNAPVQALPMHEIDFSEMPAGRPRIVSYAGKWDTESVEYRGSRPMRALPLAAAVEARCAEVARRAFYALGLCDYARVDLRLDEDNTPYVIDVNPNCDLSDGAGVSRAASYAGLSYPELIEHICVAALARSAQESESDGHRAEKRVALAGGARAPALHSRARAGRSRAAH